MYPFDTKVFQLLLQGKMQYHILLKKEKKSLNQFFFFQTLCFLLEYYSLMCLSLYTFRVIDNFSLFLSFIYAKNLCNKINFKHFFLYLLMSKIIVKKYTGCSRNDANIKRGNRGTYMKHKSVHQPWPFKLQQIE